MIARIFRGPFALRCVSQRYQTQFHTRNQHLKFSSSMSQLNSDPPKGDVDSRNAILRVRALLAQCKAESNEEAGWDAAWREGATPWDSGVPQPALRQVFETSIWSDLWLSKSGKALVPGCGRGYDAIYLASQGYSVLGADLSSAAVGEARKYLASLPEGDKIQVEYQVIDFFKGPELTHHSFDLVYDYTFFCAIPPKMRELWGRRMAELIKPGGYLIALMYPIDPARARDDGPPFPVDFEAYSAVLQEAWDNVLNIIPTTSRPNHEGRERLGVWKRSTSSTTTN